MKHLIFAYGTLTDTTVRNTVTGRKVHSEKDYLIGYQMEEICLDNKTYPIIVRNSTKKNLIKGEIFEVSAHELRLIDLYESVVYKRERAILASGLEAWVYIRS